MESTFTETVNPTKSIIIVGIIYSLTCMDLTDFNCSFLNKPLENFSKKEKPFFLLGDFNVNLLNCNEHSQTNQFLDPLVSNWFIPLTLQPTRRTSYSNTLDNLFPNFIDLDIISGNLNVTISNHLSQFAIFHNHV